MSNTNSLNLHQAGSYCFSHNAIHVTFRTALTFISSFVVCCMPTIFNFSVDCIVSYVTVSFFSFQQDRCCVFLFCRWAQFCRSIHEIDSNVKSMTQGQSVSYWWRLLCVCDNWISLRRLPEIQLFVLYLQYNADQCLQLTKVLLHDIAIQK